MLEIKIIGNKIAEARKRINISQAQLAQRLFISSQAVGKWERGESMPDITTFNRLAEILGVDLNYFSESFPSEVAEAASVEPLIEQPDELSSGKQAKKLSWNMSNTNWVDADFSGLKNLHEKFSSSNLQRCKFIGSDMAGLLLKGNNVDSCDFSGSDISSSQIQGSHLMNNLFKDSSLKKAEFSKSFIKGCDFSGASLSEAEFSKSHIQGCDLSGTSLKEAEFSSSHIEGCDCSGADFTGLEFKSGGFENSPITNAVWNRTSFIGMQIADIVFDGTVEDCYFENCAFTRVTFQHSTLINTFFKNNRNLKRVQFIDCQADRMTYEFLKSGKADLTGITLLTS